MPLTIGQSVSKRGLRRIAMVLVSVTVAMDVGMALTPGDGIHRSSQGTRHKGSKGNAVLPPMIEVEERQKFKPSMKKKTTSMQNRGTMDDRSLPSVIPKLSDVLKGARTNDPNSYTKEKTGKTSRRQNIQSDISGVPWRAEFKASIRTQGRIKKEFSTFNVGEQPNLKSKRILRALLSTHPTHCNAANVVAALSFSAKALGSKIIEGDDELRAMIFDTLNILQGLVEEEELSTRQLCNAVWAIAKHYDRDNSLLPLPPDPAALSSDVVVGAAERWDVSRMNEIDDRRQRVDETVDEIARQLSLILEKSQRMNAEDEVEATAQPKTGEICMACWAFGKLRHRSTPPGWQIPPQLGMFPAARSSENMPRAGNLVTFERWGSFGKTRPKEDDMMEMLGSDMVVGNLFDNIAISLCRENGVPNTELIKDSGVSNRSEDRQSCLMQCTWSELANVGWAFASHGRCRSKESEMLLQQLAREARRRLQQGGRANEDFLVRDIAQMLWALGTLQADNFRLGDDLVMVVDALTDYLRLSGPSPTFGRGRPLVRWSCADLVQVALSLAHARIDELPLLRAIFEESHHRLLEDSHRGGGDEEKRNFFRPWEVSILLWAQARLYLKEEQGVVFEEFARDAPRFLLSSLSGSRDSLVSYGIGPQEQANIAWSLTVLQSHQSREAVELLNMIFLEAAGACNEQHSIQLEHAHQLWQAYFLLEEERPESIRDVPAWFADYLKEKWSLEKARDKQSSARHRSLSQTLNLMGVRHFNEHDEDIDVAIVLKDDALWTHETETDGTSRNRVSVAVEFDGPNHFTREKRNTNVRETPRALGHTVLKYRLLKKQGWTVVRVPYFEFDRIPFWASMVSFLPFPPFINL